MNSGFTYPCINTGLILIYRKEEFFKVFIHESIHAYGVDKALHNDLNSNSNYIKLINLFAIKNKDYIGINESLTEFWAFLSHLCMYSFINSSNLYTFKNNFERFYIIEVKHSLYQIAKILHYNGLTYNELINKGIIKFSETSHIFSYYILKLLLVINHEQLFTYFIDFTDIKLKQDNIDKLFNYLHDYALDPKFIKMIGIIGEAYKNDLHKLRRKNMNHLLTNLKMMTLDYEL